MTLGPFAGESVQAAKEKMKRLMVEQGSVVIYWEPEGDVFFFDVTTTTKEATPPGLWDDQSVNATRAYQSTATVAFVP